MEEPVTHACNEPTAFTDDTFPDWEIQQTRGRRWILDFAKRGGVGAEFGVFRGHFSYEIASVLRPRLLFLVDPWTKLGDFFDWGDDPYTNHNRLTTAQAKADTELRVQVFGSRVKLIEDYCEAFCRERQRDLVLDFAYLDTTHNYESTFAELEVIAKILEPHGVIMGDDWVPDRADVHAGVVRAVNDFTRKSAFEVIGAGPYNQWCIRHR
jgi:hypothetical protein